MAYGATARQSGLSNSDARTLFLSSAIRKAQWSNPGQTPALGTTLSVVLPKAGIARALLVTVSVPITIGTTAGIPSPKAPFNLFTNAHLQDYAGIDRVNASVFMLSQLQLLKQRMWEPSSSYPYVNPEGTIAATTSPYVAATLPLGMSAPYSPTTTQGGGVNSFSSAPTGGASTQVGARWKVPTAVASNNLVFSFWIPVAYDMKDTRGALLLNVPNGQVVLQLTINNALVATSGVDQVYVSSNGTCVFNSPTTSNIYVYTYYYDPVAVPGVPASSYPGSLPIPYEDLQLVHEVRTLTVPNFFSASSESIYSFMSGRDYYRVIASVIDGSSDGPNATAGAMLTSRITRSRWVYDGNTPTIDEYLAGYLARCQMELGREPCEGTLYYDFSERPWDANSYGSLGWGITVSSAYTTTSPAYAEFLTDALYLATMSNA